MSEPTPRENLPPFVPPVSAFTGPVAELIAQRMLVPPLRPGLLAAVDHFEILRVLGGGGMGIVLLARDSKAGRDVAIKLVRSDLVTDQHVVHRFLKEAGHLKRLRHTNIVPVHEISERPESPYFVMPYFEKGSLANRIKPGQPLDTETILDIAAQVAEGLSFAHRSGIIHRDLKPANILLGANGQVCIADFGLARTVFNDTIVDVESRQLEGTAPYMSPAVAAGDAEDTRCDIYSFGALLYEMLTGQPPYTGRGTKEVLDQILAGPPKPITNLNPAADRGLAAVAQKAMARELRDRYADMRDALTDLQQIKEGKSPVGQRKTGGGLHISKAVWIPACIAAIALAGWIFWCEHPKTISTPTVSTPAVPAPTRVASLASVPPAAENPMPALGIITLAGQVGTAGYADGTGRQARFLLPNTVAVDASGNVYVADTANNVIRKITPDGTVSTLAGVAGSHGSADGAGNIARVLGELSVAGSANTARFWAPFGVAVGAWGDIYVADSANNVIRKITQGGQVTTLAGLAGHAGSNDGVDAEARFRNPWSVAVDGPGNVFVADMSNDTIRKIAPSGRVSTLAGQAGMSGNADGIGGNARFNDPFAVAVDKEDNVYVSDSGNNTIRKITPGGSVVTVAGLPGYAGSADGTGSDARFWNPQGLAVDNAGNIYVADTGNNAIRKIAPTGMVTTLSKLVGINGGNVRLNNPGGVAVDAAGNIYVADTNNHCVRKIASALLQ
jgi:serine/threonine protein kinase/sugar lactone lactonase YvrE